MAKIDLEDKGINVKDVLQDSEYVLLVACSDCGEVLNDTKLMTGKELGRLWGRLVMSSPLVTPSCPNGCRASYSDCNANTNLLIRAA